MLVTIKRLSERIGLCGKPEANMQMLTRATGRRHPAALWDYTVLTDTRHRWTHPTLTTAREAGTRFMYPGGMEGW